MVLAIQDGPLRILGQLHGCREKDMVPTSMTQHVMCIGNYTDTIMLDMNYEDVLTEWKG